MKALQKVVNIIEKLTDILSGHLQAVIIFLLMVMLLAEVLGEHSFTKTRVIPGDVVALRPGRGLRYPLHNVQNGLHLLTSISKLFPQSWSELFNDLKPGVDMAKAAAVDVAAAAWSHNIPMVRAYMQANCVATFSTVEDFAGFVL